MQLVQPATPALDVPATPPGQAETERPLQTTFDTPPVAVRGLDRSAAKHILVPSVGIKANIDQIGLKSDGTLETPSYERYKNAAWYKLGPSPGEVGPAVILGHVDSKSERAVFFDLRRVVPGAKIEISRADGSKVLFTVDSIEQFPKSAFPTQRVYGPTAYPTLRLITCGGKFDRQRREYVDNIIVFASLAA